MAEAEEQRGIRCPFCGVEGREEPATAPGYVGTVRLLYVCGTFGLRWESYDPPRVRMQMSGDCGRKGSRERISNAR